MSVFGSHWVEQIRGLTSAERLLLVWLVDRYNVKTKRCYPGHRSLRFQMECSETYLSQVFQSLEAKRFLTRQPRRIGNTQTSNETILNFDRWFPFHSEEVEREEKRLLAYFRDAIEPELAQGLLSTWIEKPKVGNQPNRFKHAGFTGRSGRKQPYGLALWLAIRSEDIFEHLKLKLSAIHAQIEKDTHHIYEYKHLHVWLKTPSGSDFD